MAQARTVKELRDSQQLRLMRLYPGTLVKEALGTILVPVPMTARVGGKALRDVEVLTWARQLIQAVLLDDIAAASSASSASSGAARSAVGAP